MGSSLFNMMNSINGNNSSINNFFSHINEFNNFRNSFKGNPQQEGEALLKSGRMSQEQFQQFAQMANFIRPLLK